MKSMKLIKLPAFLPFACLAFLILFTLIIVSSCSSDNNAKNTGNDENASAAANENGGNGIQETEESVDPRLLVSDDLPDTDLQGYKFRIYTHNYASKGHSDYAVDYDPETQTGDIIADAVYMRNRTVEERFNCNIVTIDSGTDDYAAHSSGIKKIISAGDDAFDIALEHIVAGPNLSLEGLFMNLLDIEYLNTDKPWWYKTSNDELTLMGQMYMGSNAIFYSGIEQTWALYVDKDLLADFGLEMPYNDVFNGTWTMDKLIGLTKDVYTDVNGDGVRDSSDIYGYTALSVEATFLTSLEVPILKKTESGLEITVNNERTVSVIEKLYDWFYGTQGCNALPYGVITDGLEVYPFVYSAFSGKKSLVVSGKIKDAVEQYRSADIQYGLLPFPKYDENQEVYRSFAGDEFFAVPVTNADPSRTGLIIEAMAAEGYKQIYPAYYEVALKKKYLHDDESVRILDIIVDSRAIAFSYVYDNWQGFGHMFNDFFTAKPTKDFASYYEKRINSAQKRVDLINNSFEGMKNK